jgi:hypothetical protein
MIIVLEGPAATDGDEPRIPDLGEDHQFAHLALVSAKGSGIGLGRTFDLLIQRTPDGFRMPLRTGVILAGATNLA